MPQSSNARPNIDQSSEISLFSYRGCSCFVCTDCKWVLPVYNRRLIPNGAAFIYPNESRSQIKIKNPRKSRDGMHSSVTWQAYGLGVGAHNCGYSRCTLARSVSMSDREHTRWQHNRIYPHRTSPCVYTYDKRLYCCETVDAHCSNIIRS